MKATHQPSTTLVSDPMRPSALLRGAAAYLDGHGWLKGEIFANSSADNPFPAACSIGAINICAHGRPILSADDAIEDDFTDAAIRAMRVLAASIDVDYASGVTDVAAIDIVAAFNDDERRTLTEVIEALTEAADDWDHTHHTGGAR